MAIVFLDGFDKYGPPGVVTPNFPNFVTGAGTWTSSGRTDSPLTVAGLSSTGYAMNMSGALSGHISRTLPASYSRLIGGVRFQPVVGFALTVCMVSFLNNTTAACSIQINVNGTIALIQGSFGGTALATSSASVSNGSTHFLEWDITFGTAASYQLWLDGASLFSGTGNTGNILVNTFQIGTNGGGNSCTYDDLYLFDSTTATNNAVLLTSPRIETQFPIADAQTQWTELGHSLGGLGNYSATSSTNAPGANTLFLVQRTASVSGTLLSVACVPSATSGTAKFKAVVYTDSSGAPGTLIATGNEVVGATSGTTLVSAFSVGQAVTAGTVYWVGFITDTSVVLQQTDATTVGQQAVNTYTSGAPASAPTMTSGKPNWRIWGNCNGATTNWEAQALNPPTGDASAAESNTVGQEDLYSYPALTVTPPAIYAMAVYGYVRRSDTGTRTVNLNCKSGSTNSTGSNPGQTPALSYAFLSSYFPTDPATGAAWTASGVNAATSGISVAS